MYMQQQAHTEDWCGHVYACEIGDLKLGPIGEAREVWNRGSEGEGEGLVD